MRNRRNQVAVWSLAVVAIATVGFTSAASADTGHVGPQIPRFTTGIPPATGATATYTVTGSSSPYTLYQGRKP